MASLSEIARPYAKVAFGLAQSTGKFDLWQTAILFAQALQGDREFKSVLRKTKRSNVHALIENLAEGIVSGQELRFVQELVTASRLDAADKILEIYEGLRAQKDGFASVEIKSAKTIDAAEAKVLIAALERQFNIKLRPLFKVDPAIEGGFIARVGDKVYDASVRGALERISNALLN